MTPARAARLDALRGAAMLWMAGFHACVDASMLGLMPVQDFFADPFWVVQRSLILGSFLGCAGAGLALAQSRGRSARAFWRRWAAIAGCALVVSIGSWFLFPDTWISFGVLHGVALMLPLTLPLLGRLGTAGFAMAGAVALVLPWWLQHPVFDQRALDWIGLVTHKPAVEDFVPLMPWIGAVWWGVAAVRWLAAHRPAWLSGGLASPLKPLAALGRWPLSFYMLHQPVLIGLMLAWRG